ncbi:MAG: 3-isopropylmalate dehydrogenase [Gemmatimonadaceae bacterium]|nr:3-isopropylmalate dehydrogenase [Gemmatimonadaceae bacterium]
MRATIALLPGDGIGPEVVGAARGVLEAVAARFGHTFELVEALVGGAAIEATGVPLPPRTLALCERADAVLLGAVGGPQWDSPTARVRPEQGLLALRRALGVYANLRPVAPIPALAAASPLKPELLAGVDLVVVRELTGGIYFGTKTLDQSVTGETATDLCTYTTAEIERVVRVAAELARTRHGHVTSVDKANVLETSRLWRRVTSRVMAAEYPDVRLEHLLVDACAMHLIRRPADFDVIVTENMFGDILTDEASVLAGSIGLLPSASLGAAVGAGGTRRGLYEPIHGSAPDLAGKGVANPLGTISSVAMLLRYSLALEAEARAVDDAVRATIDDGIVTADVVPPGADARRAYSTAEVAQRVVEHLAAPVAHR